MEPHVWFRSERSSTRRQLREAHRPKRRLERLTAEVAQRIWDDLKPQAVAVVIEAQHGCMTGRGMRTQASA